MENLIWLVLIGSLFFFLMRKGGGCCGGHSHSDHGKHAEKQSSPGDNVPDKKKTHCH